MENEFGCELSWEPLDGKRATRVAIYCIGSISEESELSDIKSWHINNLIKFKSSFDKRLRKYLR
ncbi:DUF4268 domain-containing protein [Vibrio cholerae]|nr:DUF4268 domain-containing protein [Vibrio cholerae]